MRRVAVLCVALVSCACSSSPAPIGGADAGVDAGGFAPAPPVIPWLVSGVPVELAPDGACPSGWTRVEDPDLVVCEPFASAGPETCAVGSAHFPGAAGCAVVGRACPSGSWADGLPATGVLYVRAGAAAGGDGTMSAPFGRIANAMAVATSGTIIALSRDRFDELVRMRADVTLQGACSAETILTSSVASESNGVVEVVAGGAGVRDLRIEGAARGGLWIRGAAADATVEGVVISNVRSVGVLVSRGAHLAATQLVIADTRSNASDGGFGIGLDVETGARAEVTGGLFDRNRDLGVFGAGPDASITLTDVAIRDTQSREGDGLSGGGLALQNGATAEVTRALFAGNHNIAIIARSPGSGVRLEDVVIRDTLPEEATSQRGVGLDLDDGATADVTRALLERNLNLGVLVRGAGTVATLRDVVVRDTESRRDLAADGLGLLVDQGASLHLTRAIVARNRAVGVFVTGDGTSATLEDLVVRDTRSNETDHDFGRGIVVQLGPTVTISRALVERNLDDAVSIGGNVDARLSDIVIRDTESAESTGQFGRGLDVQRGAMVTVTRAELRNDREVDVFVGEANVQLEDVVIEATRPAACGEACGPGQGGVGLGSYYAATVSLRRFAIRNPRLCGVMVARDGMLDLVDGEVRGAMIGACVQVADYDFARLSMGVMYVDNGSNIAATELPVPEGTPELGP